MNENFYIEMWLMFKGYLEEGQEEIAAEHYVTLLVDHEVDLSELEHIIGEDSVLDVAVNNYLDEHSEEEL